ncbi:hypothetical protein RB195_008347 [Necator americanus]|uniref:Uncharacterized protein n=1 Tax=Necator americanus TaxID=51031 RepID=A0ABR1CN66_NECAM
MLECMDSIKDWRMTEGRQELLGYFILREPAIATVPRFWKLPRNFAEPRLATKSSTGGLCIICFIHD